MLLEQSISQTSAETKCNSFVYLFAQKKFQVIIREKS